MLQELRVHNLALIDALHLDLAAQPTGLVVLTGETGAGKSIILQAINLLTGGRGAAGWVRNDCEQAGIEAVFVLRPDHAELHGLLEEHALADGGACLVRRILTREGRSKVFVNDQSVTTRLAGDLASHLINVASQHDHQQLLNVRNHLDLLDAFGELKGRRLAFGELFRQWREAAAALRALREKERDREQQGDFLRFQLEEIRKCGPKPEEDELLRQERDRLKASDALVKFAGGSRRRLEEVASGALVTLRKDLEQAAALDASLRPLAERISAAGFELEDVSGQLARYLEALPTDPSRLEEISGRLADLKQLQRKYGPTLTEVLAFTEAGERDLALLESLEEEIGRAEGQLRALEVTVLDAAAALTRARQEAAARLETGMALELASLSFPQAIFQVGLTGPAQPGAQGLHAEGADAVEFRFSANPGEPPKPLARIVSGGELSRLMLALKCLLARRDQVDTVIFDEVDAGIGGQAAEAVATKISELAGHHQVLCITHLPQIAARADLHFKVAKQVEDGRTRTVIQPLCREERIGELARMLGGEQPTAQTLVYARELIERGTKERLA